MTIIKIISLSLFALIVIILIKSVNKDLSVFALIAINLTLTTFSILMLNPVFEYVSSLCATEHYKSIYKIMFKAFGVSILCAFCSELCHDAGEQSLGAKIELCTKCTLLTYTIPVIEKLFDYAKDFIS